MRVTTGMVNESARRAGMPELTGSLLDYVDGGKKSNLESAAVSKKTAAAEKIKAKDSVKLEKSAGNLKDAAEAFADKEKDGDREGMIEAAESIVNSYNESLSILKKSASTLEQFYQKKLKEAGEDNKSLFAAVGVTVKEDGTLSLDRDKLKNADDEALSKAFGNSGVFGEKAAFLAEHISDNAAKLTESISGKYGSDGTMSSYVSNKYDWVG